MKAEIKKQKDTKVEIDFELSWEEFEAYYQKAINKISQGVMGTVPSLSLVCPQKYGKTNKRIL